MWDDEWAVTGKKWNLEAQDLSLLFKPAVLHKFKAGPRSPLNFVEQPVPHFRIIEAAPRQRTLDQCWQRYEAMVGLI